MKKLFRNNIFYRSAGQLFIIGLLSLTVACEDEPARISGDVLPEAEIIKGFSHDSHILDTRNVARDQVRTSDATYGIIGAFNDPVFGETKADFVTDFSIGTKVSYGIKYIDADGAEQDTVLYKFNNTNKDAFPNDEWDVDSLVLNLQYQFNNWYGDMFSMQNLKIYEIDPNEDLGDNRTVYYNDHEMEGLYLTEAIAETSVHPNGEVPLKYRSIRWNSEELFWEYPDSVWKAPGYLWEVDSAYVADGGKGHTQTTKNWEIKLDKDLADRFFQMSKDQLASTALFKSVFNGIYVTSELESGSAIGSLTKINLLSSGSTVATNLKIHLSRDHKYKNAQDEIRDTTSLYSYTFPINVENVRFNRYNHNLSSGIDLDEPDTDRLYVQGMAGSYMRMELPEEMRYWVDSIGDPAKGASLDYHLAANIEFLMEVDTVSTNIKRYPMPSKLTIKWLDKDKKLVNPIYETVVDGKKIEYPVFGGNPDSQGNRAGLGEIVPRTSVNDPYLYRFIMRADYFNFIMRQLSNEMREGGYDIDDPEFIELFKKRFGSEFFIGPENTTSTFQRVILFGGTKSNEKLDVNGKILDKRMRMNVKYYQYRPR